MGPPRAVRLGVPSWVGEFVEWGREYASDEDRMELAVALARENVARGTGGPFGAAVFRNDTGRVVAAGVNGVAQGNNSMLHAEVVALALAEGAVASFTLQADHLPVHELVTSCEPCAMCLGAILWSGVRRVVCGALREDASRIGFDEGPVFDESYRYLRSRGIAFERGVLRETARAVLEQYESDGGIIYNG